MIRKKIVIVGAGIIGLVSAYLLNKRKFDVEIYETKSKLGGINNDILNKNNNYISGCQYFENSFWFNKLPNMLKKDFYKTKVNYYSYCDIFNNKNTITDNYPDLSYDKKLELNLSEQSNSYKCETLLDRCLLYPKNLSEPLLKWVSRYKLNEKNMIADSHKNGLMFARIFLKENDNLKKLKKESKLYDYIYGAPRKERLDGLLPHSGYDIFFEEFSNYLRKKGVKIHTRSPLKVKWVGKKLEIFKINKKIENKRILWTGNPTPLIKEYNSVKLDSASISIRIIIFNVEGNLSSPFYIQTYSNKSSILRIFFYKLNNQNVCAIECFDENEDLEKIREFGNNILKSINKNITIKNLKVTEKLQKRYSVLTKSDKETLEKFKHFAKKTNLIVSPWELYSREIKLLNINKIIENLNV